MPIPHEESPVEFKSLFDEIPSGPAFRLGVFLTHQFLAPVALFVLLLGAQDTSALIEFTAATMGLAVGAWVAFVLPRYAAEGRWIWLAPVVFFGILLVRDLGRDFHPALFLEFFFDSPNPSSCCYRLSLISLVLWGFCCYSIGVAWTLRRGRRDLQSQSENSGRKMGRTLLR